MAKTKRQLYRVVLVFPLSITHSVFVKERSRTKAEEYALRKYPNAIRVDRSPFPQN